MEAEWEQTPQLVRFPKPRDQKLAMQQLVLRPRRWLLEPWELLELLELRAAKVAAYSCLAQRSWQTVGWLVLPARLVVEVQQAHLASPGPER